MEINKIKKLLQRYFDGVSSADEEKILSDYFQSDKIDEELSEYRIFFTGIAELSGQSHKSDIEEEIMDFILEHESQEKSRYRWLWQTVTGIAASILIVLGGILLYEQQKQPFDDTFKNPDEAYVYAEKTLQYVAGKYVSGFAQLTKVEKYNDGIHQLDRMVKLDQASKPLSNGLKQINKGFTEMNEIKDLSINKNEKP